MAKFDLRRKTITLPEGFNDYEKLHIGTTELEDHFVITEHYLGTVQRADGVYKFRKQAELKHLGCKSADIEFAFHFKNKTIIKLINKVL